MAYMKKHCSGCCSGCNNGYAQVNCTNNSCNNGCGCSSCNHNHGCNSCTSCSCNSYGRSGNGFGALRSVTGPFSNCGNWWNNDDSFPYYTGPCGPCEPCGQCCCREWPWPWPPMPPVMPVNDGCGYSERNRYDGRCGGKCGGKCDDHDHYDRHSDDRYYKGYTSNKNCYHTEASNCEACAARKVKPIVEYNGHSHGCDDC